MKIDIISKRGVGCDETIYGVQDYGPVADGKYFKVASESRIIYVPTKEIRVVRIDPK